MRKPLYGGGGGGGENSEVRVAELRTQSAPTRVSPQAQQVAQHQ